MRAAAAARRGDALPPRLVRGAQLLELGSAVAVPRILVLRRGTGARRSSGAREPRTPPAQPRAVAAVAHRVQLARERVVRLFDLVRRCVGSTLEQVVVAGLLGAAARARARGRAGAEGRQAEGRRRAVAEGGAARAKAAAARSAAEELRQLLPPRLHRLQHVVVAARVGGAGWRAGRGFSARESVPALQSAVASAMRCCCCTRALCA
jgi:hypothetical protein